MSCLDRRLTQVDALAAALSEADLSVVSKAVELASSLEPLSGCADADALLRGPDRALDAHSRETVARSDELLARGEAANRLARYAEASQFATQAIELTRPLSSHPIHARALQLLGGCQAAQGANEDAERTYDRAIEAALRSADNKRIASVLIAQANHIGYALARPEEGQRLIGYARAALVNLEDSEQEAHLENTLGLFAYGRGDNDVAITHFERVHELRATQWGDDHPQTANILNNLGAIAFAKSDYPGSRAYHERTLAIWRAAYGPNHPDVAVSLNNLASLADIEGDYPRAEALYREALDIRERALGLGHPDVAATSSNLGISLESAQRPADAIVAHRRALEIYEHSYGPTHPRLAGPLTGISRSLLALGERDSLEEAQVLAERSLQIRSAADVAPYDLAQSQLALAKILLTREADRLRALELALAARALLDPLEGVEPELAEINTLLELMNTKLPPPP